MGKPKLKPVPPYRSTAWDISWDSSTWDDLKHTVKGTGDASSESHSHEVLIKRKMKPRSPVPIHLRTGSMP